MNQMAVQAQLKIVNPVAEAESDGANADRHAPAARPATLDGLTIGLYWNGKNNGNVALARTREHLERLYRDLTFVDVLGEKGGINRYLSPPQIEALAAECDAVVATTADCGSCTSWLMRDMCELERRGTPAVGFTAKIFEEDAHFSAKTFGVPEVCQVIVPETFTNRTAEQIHRMVDEAIPAIIAGLTKPREIMAVLPRLEHVSQHAGPELDYRGTDLLQALDAMNADFIRRGWSDGMPLVPPTEEKVAAMIAASGRDGDEVVGKFAPAFGIGTVRKIAANAVMAGCQPPVMPVVMAMMDCILDPAAGLRTFAMSTGPQAPVVMVSGPIAKRIGMNSGICALGPGSISHVNVGIGRALRLIMMNVGHSYPGVGDMDTIGNAMKFSACIAENEDRTPWKPYRVEAGFSAAQSTVTVNVPYGACELFDFQNSDPEKLVENFATVTSNGCGGPGQGTWLIKNNADINAGYPFSGRFQNLIMLCPEHAKVFADAGWSVRDIKEALHRRSRLAFNKLMLNKPIELFRHVHPELQFLLDAPETEISVYPSPDYFDIIVVGAEAGRSLFFFGGNQSITKPVRE
jgi:hypothetical protein